MKRLIIGMFCALSLSGCLAGNMVRGLSLKGKPLTAVEQRYGQPDSQEAITGGTRYTWNAPDDQRPCTLMVTTDRAERVTDVKTVGGNQACYHFGNAASTRR